MMQQLGEVLKKATGFLQSKNILEPRLSAEWLLCDVLKMSRMDLYMHFDRPLTTQELDAYREYIKRRSLSEPVAYILGTQPFCGLNLNVSKDVLIPRPETEELVELCLKILKDKASIKGLDLCTGSGAIALSIKKMRNDIEMFASDISEKALSVAKSNAKKHELDISFVHSDLFSAIDEKFDFIVSNPPYIKTDVVLSLDKDVKDFEPKLALDGGVTGLDIYEKIARQAKDFLNPEGLIFLEIGYDQENQVRSIFENYGFKNIFSLKDSNQKDRFVIMSAT
jgi:release factor glutamine methyltransferase